LKHKDREYLYSLRKYILIVTGLFILSLIIGLMISVIYPGFSENYFEMFQQSVGWITTLNPLAIMLVIFLNNAIKSLVALVLGIGLGIIPFLFVAGNGIILGIVIGFISRQQGALFVIAALLPHGIIEIPMVLISAGIGLKLGYVMYLSLIGMQTDIRQGKPYIKTIITRLRTDIKPELKQGFWFYIRWIAPLLFLAAIIETFITPVIVWLLRLWEFL